MMSARNLEEIIKDSKIMIGTPMYGGMCSMAYLHGAVDLLATCFKLGLPMSLETLGNESLISRARNHISDRFMKSDCTHLMWIDADTEFKGSDILELLALDKDICTGLLAKKTVNWDKVKSNVNENNINNLSADQLKSMSVDFVFNAEGEIVEPSKIFKVKQAGNAFLMIKKKVFNDYREAYPDLEYDEYQNQGENAGQSEKRFAYFDTAIVSEGGKKYYLSEDYYFSENVRKLGYEVWACPWLNLGHVGTHVFGGDIQALAKIGNFNI